MMSCIILHMPMLSVALFYCVCLVYNFERYSLGSYPEQYGPRAVGHNKDVILSHTHGNGNVNLSLSHELATPGFSPKFTSWSSPCKCIDLLPDQ